MKTVVFLLPMVLCAVHELAGQTNSDACRQPAAGTSDEAAAELGAKKLEGVASELKKSDNPHLNKYAYVLAASVWNRSSIYVCWENPDPGFGEPMNMVQQAIADTWQKESQLQFTGWQKCATKNAGIRILVDDSGPHTKGLGCRLNGLPNGMVLNFTFNTWSPACRNMTAYCIKGIAVHEFGHAIGFAHEQNRPDTPGECQQPKQGQNGDLLLTPYDPNSVMNYCNQKYNNDGKLSRLDIDAVQKLYGKLNAK